MLNPLEIYLSARTLTSCFSLKFSFTFRVGFSDPIAAWIKVFVTNVNGFQLLVVVKRDLVLDISRALFPLLFHFTLQEYSAT